MDAPRAFDPERAFEPVLRRVAMIIVAVAAVAFGWSDGGTSAGRGVRGNVGILARQSIPEMPRVRPPRDE
jgi:hypothetical protein